MAQRSPSLWIWAAVHWTCSCYQENSTVPWVPSAWSAWRWSCWWMCHCWQLPFWGLWRRFWMIFGCCDVSVVSIFFWVSFVLEGFRFVINWIFQVGPSVPKKKRTWNPLQLVFFTPASRSARAPAAGWRSSSLWSPPACASSSTMMQPLWSNSWLGQGPTPRSQWWDDVTPGTGR